MKNNYEIFSESTSVIEKNWQEILLGLDFLSRFLDRLYLNSAIIYNYLN